MTVVTITALSVSQASCYRGISRLTRMT